MEVDTIAKEGKDEIISEVVNIETKFKVVEEDNAAKVGKGDGGGDCKPSGQPA